MSFDEDAMQAMEEVYDIMFANRYTDEDDDYKQTISSPLADPPCLENYFNKPKRNFDNRGGRDGGRGVGRDDRRGWHGNQRQDYNRDQGHGHQGHHSRHGNNDRYAPDRHQRREGHHYHPYSQGRR